MRNHVTLDTVRTLALALPGVEEGTSYGTPAFRVRGKFLARMHQDGESLVVKVDFETRKSLMELEPRTYYITDHYRDYPTILVRLANVDADDLGRLLAASWRLNAPKRLVETHTERPG